MCKNTKDLGVGFYCTVRNKLKEGRGDTIQR
jgi:hypothetical protein